jgi:hypothetical protein
MVTKIQTHAMSRSCLDDALLFSGWMRLYRGKRFARWVYKDTNARDDSDSVSEQCGDQKIARFRTHLSEYRLGAHIGRTSYKIL